MDVLEKNLLMEKHSIIYDPSERKRFEKEYHIDLWDKFDYYHPKLSIAFNIISWAAVIALPSYGLISCLKN